MVAITIRSEEACERQPDLLWDSVWVQRLDATGGYADWLLAGPGDQPESRGGLRAEAALHTATLLCLFSDRRLPDGTRHPGNDADPRGWWGDQVRLDGEPEAELGSLLWTLERAVCDEATARLAKAYAEEALAVLLREGAVARTEVRVGFSPAIGRLDLEVAHYSHAGERSYSQRFAHLWAQSRNGAPMNFGDRAPWASGGAALPPGTLTWGQALAWGERLLTWI